LPRPPRRRRGLIVGAARGADAGVGLRLRAGADNKLATYDQSSTTSSKVAGRASDNVKIVEAGRRRRGARVFALVSSKRQR
jgi:hypothetical protein